MCLAIPGRVVRWVNREFPFCQAEIQFQGIHRICNLACVADAEPGDYVIIHAGVAISRIDTEAAEQLIQELDQAMIDDEWQESDREISG